MILVLFALLNILLGLFTIATYRYINHFYTKIEFFIVMPIFVLSSNYIFLFYADKFGIL